MTITPATLSRLAGAAAMAAGLIFMGVQIGHPHLDTTSITTTELAVRDSLKVLMATLALVGFTGLYLRQVRQMGVLGLVGYVLIATGYLFILGTAYVAATVLPSVAGTDPSFVSDAIAASKSDPFTGDIGLLKPAILVQSVGYLAGGLIFGIALFRARVLSRWASALLALGGVLAVTLSLLPDSFYRYLAFPNAIAMVGLGWSLWRSPVPALPAPVDEMESGTPANGVTNRSSWLHEEPSRVPGLPADAPHGLLRQQQ